MSNYNYGRQFPIVYSNKKIMVKNKGLEVGFESTIRAKVRGKENSTFSNDSHIPDEYLEAWYELGSPIQFPFLKYLISVTIYLVDNFFLVKNTYNAITQGSGGETVGNDDEGISHPQIIAAAIVVLHLLSSILISIIDSLNKDAIYGRRGKYLNRQHKSVIFFRLLAHFTLTMKLFRFTTAYLENRRRNKDLHKLRMRRSNVSEDEIQFVVDQKKNQLVESHYDLVESFFKTVPAALLQVFFMFQTNPDARLRLYSTVDQDRFATVFFTIITAAISSANYQLDYLTYKKVLHFQDCFRSDFTHQINLKIPGDLCLATNIPIQIATIGNRICFYSVLIFWSPFQFAITTLVILLLNWLLTFVWSPTAWRFRPVLENPLFGLPWLCFDIIDLWINLFVPGVHYPKPLDHFLNFYTTLITGVIVFRGFDFLTPSRTSTSPQFLPNATMLNSSTSFETRDPFQYFNITSGSSSDEVGESGSSQFLIPFQLVDKEQEQDSLYIIKTIIKWFVIIHEYLTFNQISYAGFFYNVAKYMNVINLACFTYTCAMNYLQLYDLDFPIQIVNSFYLTMFHSLHSKRIGRPVEMQPELRMDLEIENKKPLLIPSNAITITKGEIFLVFSMLPNSRFFRNIHTLKKSQWTFVNSAELDKLVHQVIQEGHGGVPSKCYLCLDKFLKMISPVLYPARFREPKFKWNLPTDKVSIISSLRTHPLRELMIMYINDLYDGVKQDRKLLLAVFCANYNDIVRHYTSLRLKKMFEFFDIPIEKGKVYARMVNRKGKKLKRDYELGYMQRLSREVMGKVDKIFP